MAWRANERQRTNDRPTIGLKAPHVGAKADRRRRNVEPARRNSRAHGRLTKTFRTYATVHSRQRWSSKSITANRAAKSK